jgi:CubicO group peptidase (beta-lactamase class C family)
MMPGDGRRRWKGYPLALLELTGWLIVGAACGRPAATAPAATIAPDRALIQDSTIQRALNERVASRRNVGLVVGLVDGRRARYFVSGTADGPGSNRLDENTVFEIGSVTKAFTAGVLADMVRREEVRLENPVSVLLPQSLRVPPDGGGRITLLELATQSSGLPSTPTNLHPRVLDDPYREYSEADLFGFLRGYSLNQPAADRYEYSNFGIALLGDVLARRAGIPYSELLRRRLLAPLGMRASSVAISGTDRVPTAIGHDVAGDTVSYWTFDAMAPAGGVLSTVADMVRFLRAQLGEGDAALVEALRSTQTVRRVASSANDSIGLVWHSARYYGARIVWHSGETAGFASFVGFMPDVGRGVVVLSNSSTSVNDLGFYVLEPRLGLHPPAAPPLDFAVDSTLLDSYVGEYLAGRDRMTLTRRGTRMYSQVTNQLRYRIYARPDSTFYWAVVPDTIGFQRDSLGRVVAAILKERGKQTLLPRVAP